MLNCVAYLIAFALRKHQVKGCKDQATRLDYLDNVDLFGHLLSCRLQLFHTFCLFAALVHATLEKAAWNQIEKPLIETSAQHCYPLIKTSVIFHLSPTLPSTILLPNYPIG